MVCGGPHGRIDRLGHDVAAHQVADVVDQQAQPIRGQAALGFRKRAHDHMRDDLGLEGKPEAEDQERGDRTPERSEGAVIARLRVQLHETGAPAGQRKGFPPPDVIGGRRQGKQDNEKGERSHLADSLPADGF